MKSAQIIKILVKGILLLTIVSCSPTGHELQRKEEVRSLIQQLDCDSLEKRDLAYSELRDVYIRKRDVPDLILKASQGNNPRTTDLLRKLAAYMEGRWRLPDKGWTEDYLECLDSYLNASVQYGSSVIVTTNPSPRSEPIILMDVTFPDDVAHKPAVANLIYTLEPESLILSGGWKDVTFLDLLVNLEELSLHNTRVVDLTPLKALPNLKVLKLKNTKVTDLTPIATMPNMQFLYLDGSDGFDLSPLKDTSVSILFSRDAK